MNNATENQTGHLPVRNAAAAADLQRSREMPLLFQLADVHRAAAPVAPPAPVPLPAVTSTIASNLPLTPAPIELPKADPFPLASSVLDSWPKSSSSLFEIPTGLSTTALAIGAAVHKEEAKPLTPPATAASAPVSEKPTDKPIEKTALPVVSSGLPAAIESAVKAAAETNEPPKAEVKTEPKAEAKSEAKPEVKKTEPKTTKPAVETIAAAVATPATTEKPSPASLRRQRAEARQAKVEGKKEGDWLQSHGKVIAICFVLALIGTIYLARRNRGSVPPPPSLDTPNLAVEIPEVKHDTPAKPVEVANTAPRLVEAPSHPLDTTPSPATPVPTAPAATNTAELQPPVVPNAGQSASPPASEPLFPWQPNDSRVATRPEEPKNAPVSAPQPQPQYNAPQFNPPTPGQPTAPTLNAPTYPETNLRDAPLLPPAPANAPPATAPNTTPGAGHGGSSGRSPRSFSPASFTSAPGGNRYERTGSGLY